MSFELNPERLQTIAVKCVSQFMTKQASLNEALSKEAKDLELNSDQIKRAVEATNTLAYLRQLEDATDRTQEFPVASYKEVIARMVLPEKQAEERCEKDEKDEKKEKSSDKDEVKEKPSNTFSEREKVAMLMKETLKCKDTLIKMAYDKAGLVLEIEDSVALLRRDPLCLEKLAEVSEIDIFDKLVKLCGLEKTAQETYQVFLDKDLVEAHRLHGLYKEAKALVAEENSLVNFVTRSSELLMEKEAFIGSLIGRGIGAAIGGLGRGAVNLAKRGVNSSRSFGQAAKGAGYKSTSDGIKAFDKAVADKGIHGAKQMFGGNKPSVFNRTNKLGLGTSVLTAGTISHQNNVWDSLHGNN